MNWVKGMHRTRIKPSPRSVLRELADFADERDECWPSVETLSDCTSLSKRAVLDALAVLEEMGLIVVMRRHRTSSRYRLNRHLNLTKPLLGAPSAPQTRSARRAYKKHRLQQEASEVPVTSSACGANGAPKPAVDEAPDCGANSVVSAVQISSVFGAPSAPQPPENHQRTTRGEGAQARATPRPLDRDWQPSEEDRNYARSLGLDPKPVARRFRDHFLASGRPLADVSARWRIWCDENAERAGVTGSAPAASATSAAAEPAEAAAPACEIASLNAAWCGVHAALRQQIETAEYRAWLSRLVLLGVEEGYALIAAPGRFHRDHVAGRFKPQIEGACRALLPECRGIMLQVAEPARQCA
jgi:DNA-binding transcriptional ArsR family regulator